MSDEESNCKTEDGYIGSISVLFVSANIVALAFIVICPSCIGGLRAHELRNAYGVDIG